MCFTDLERSRIIDNIARITACCNYGFVLGGLIDVVYGFVTDLGWGRVSPMPDLSGHILGRAVHDGRRRTLPLLWALALARPSDTARDQGRDPAARWHGFPGGTGRAQSRASLSRGGRRNEAGCEQAETKRSGTLAGGSLGRLARCLSSPRLNRHPTPAGEHRGELGGITSYCCERRR